MFTRVSLKVARILIQYNDAYLVDLREFSLPSGKYCIFFSLAYGCDRVSHFVTNYLTSKASYRFMVSL